MGVPTTMTDTTIATAALGSSARDSRFDWVVLIIAVIGY
jgi:hypothetical protein